MPDASSSAVVSVIGEAVLRAEPDEAMVLVTLTALRGHARPRARGRRPPQ
jgi:hypothetical protein